MSSIPAVALTLLLIIMIFMAIRDGRPFFADALKVAVLIIAILGFLLAWFGGRFVR